MKNRFLVVFLGILLSFSVYSMVLAAGHDRCHASRRNHFAGMGGGRPIFVMSNQPEVVVKLRANRTTGFSWILAGYGPCYAQNSDLISDVHSEYIGSSSGRIGAGGESIWRFKFKDSAFDAAHVTRINMVYARPSEMTSGKEKHIIIITVPKGKTNGQ